MPATVNPEINVEDLMRRIRQEVAQRKAQIPPALETAVRWTPYASTVVAFPRLPENTECIASKPEYTLDELLKYDDDCFIRSAYLAILRREPDVTGCEHYLHMLRASQLSKAEILGRLRYSPEGKVCSTPVRGLLLPFLVQSAYHIPVLGYGVALINFLLRLPVIIRNRVSFEANTLRQQREQVAHINALTVKIESTLSKVSKKVDLEAVAQKAHLAQAEDLAAKTHEEIFSLSKALEVKADNERLTQLTSHLVQLVQRKVDADELAGTTTRLEEALAKKANVVEEDHLLDAFYVSFEDRFRGTREDIKQRVAVYLPIVKEARAGTKIAPILDVGCGRGEWLQLLQASDLVACGVDLNRVMVSQCQELGLDVSEADVIAYLRELKDNSVGAVTGLHIIEHISFKRLITLFDEVLRVLKPGGVAIFETPNPENLIVGACNFYYDPTHLRPLPPEPMKFVMEARGFASIEILRLHPQPESVMLKAGAEEIQQIVNGLLYGAQDYSLVAFKNEQFIRLRV